MNNTTYFSPMATWFHSALRNVWKACVTSPLWLAMGVSQADMLVESTRVVYPESRREVSFKIVNNSKQKAAFVQLWLDDGNPAAAPEDVVTPFNLSPPIAQIKADGGQVVRLAYTGEPLPADRESIFWFNMLELPPKTQEENKLSFAIRTRIKVFFRPKALRDDPGTMMNQVTWKLSKQGNQWVAEGANPTPFHMSFFSVSLGSGGQYDINVDGGMISPKGTISIPLGDVEKITKPYNQLKVDFINDFGGPSPVEFAVNLRP